MRGLAYIAIVLVLIGLYMSFMYAPTERVMGDVQRIMYFHVASAWNAFLAFFVVFVASIGYLVRADRRWDQIALSSAEIGVMFTTVALLSGSTWARGVWGTWWNWEPRLTTTLILWFIYVAYVLVRYATEEEERRSRLAAVFGILGFIDVPIVYLSVNWWRGLHPDVIRPGKIDMAPEMIQTLVLAVVSFTFLYFAFLRLRLRLERAQEDVELLKLKVQYRDRPRPASREG